MNAVVFDPTKFDVAARTLQLRQIRQKMDEIKEKHKKELEPFQEFEAKLMGQIIAFLQSTKQQNAKNANGTVYLSLKVTYSVQDLPEFQRHVIGTESWHMLTWGCAKTAADAWVAQHETPPPGVKRNAMVTLGVLSPPKPKTETVKSPDPSPLPQPEPGSDEYEDKKRNEVESI